MLMWLTVCLLLNGTCARKYSTGNMKTRCNQSEKYNLIEKKSYLEIVSFYTFNIKLK